MKGFDPPGAGCAMCGALDDAGAAACRRCGAPTHPVRLGEAMTERVIAAGGEVDIVEDDEMLARAGGVVAQLRYPIEHELVFTPRRNEAAG